MDKIGNGATSAFPVEAHRIWISDTETLAYPAQLGLTKREYFAGLILQSYLKTSPEGKIKLKTSCEEAVRCADALLEALK